MNPGALTAAALTLTGLIAFTGCTFIHIEGDHNVLREIGGHGDLIVKKNQPALPEPAPPPPGISTSEENPP